MSAKYHLPEHVRLAVQQAWEEFSARGVEVPLQPGQVQQLHYVWACSEFVQQSCRRRPELLADLVASGDLESGYEPGSYPVRVAAACAGVTDEIVLMKALRQLRTREMVRVAWRDIAGLAGLAETTRDLSDFADACLDAALAWQYQRLCVDIGEPVGQDSGQPQRLVVLGMGKLGAHELNFSSDIDLIFAYAEQGETRGGRRSLSNEEFFRRLAQALIRVLDSLTEDGQVFRVDMRLRPFGESGPLAMCFDAIEEYYQAHGREWERYAMIKARVVAGDRGEGEALLETLRPFVFRRYIDYGVFDSLREMKRMISQEVARKGMEDNVKLGPGGIREIEFIGQVFQLIRGGREPELQVRSILPVLKQLSALRCLPEFVVRDLLAAYEFLRASEHRLQEFRDRQTHELPRDDAGRLRLALGMGFADWDAYLKTLTRHRHKVQEHFDQLITAPQKNHGEADENGWVAVWRDADEPTACTAQLEAAGFPEPGAVAELLAGLCQGLSVRTLGGIGRERLDQVMPLLLAAAADADNALETLQRLLPLVETIVKRSAYLSLLIENPMALSQLVQLCSASAWVGHYLTRHPMLLDELLDPRSLYRPPDRAGLEQDLGQRLSRVAETDLEQQMEVMRHFKQANVLRVAAADVTGALPLMEVSDHLSWIAEVILQRLFELAWDYMVERHGSPVCSLDEAGCDIAFAVVAYGKLGGIELGYGSDLDLVFIHASPEGETSGRKPLENAVFFARLCTRMIHMLTTHTPSGTLYEVDMRLRPSGASGLLVTSIDAYAEYQRRDAWTWEHQALVRARVVVGDAPVTGHFERIRAEILCQPREEATVRREVREMRERMREQLARKIEGQFDLKQGAGGIADIEFMVQYGVLAWAARHPGLCRYTDNIRILEMFGDLGLMPEGDTRLLADAYRAFRDRVHHLALQEMPALAPEYEFSEYRAAVQDIWRRVMEAQ